MKVISTAVVLLVVFSVIVLGCARAGGDPINPTNELSMADATASAENADFHDNHMLYGQWTLFINEDHTSVDVVPMRQARLHLNALKFLESYCADCLKITKIKNNGDSTIDMTVEITHPFMGFPQYTGFDVKGIIMFNGSWTNPGYKYFYPWPEPMRVSWRKMGDPQVMNADGYTVRWSPTYDSGSDLPIFNYWPGKHAMGTPTANINAYKDFWTNEERHMFTHWGKVTRTYTIWLPPGPLVAGYAVEACWEPPTVTPVTNPLTDFPPEANQVEAYEFKVWLINNGYITPDVLPCCGKAHDPTTGHFIQKQWGGYTSHHWEVFTDQTGGGGFSLSEGGCGDTCPPEWYCGPFFNAEAYANGDYIGVALNMKGTVGADPPYSQVAYTVFEFTIDLD